MKAFQKRVVAEKKLLDLKREKLDEFMNSSAFPQLPQDEQFRLLMQIGVMAMYSNILAERILHFKEQA